MIASLTAKFRHEPDTKVRCKWCLQEHFWQHGYGTCENNCEEMEQKEIIEGNKLIAEFMRIPYQSGEYHLYTDYHNSWNNLMPVVEKIEKQKEPLCYIEIIGHNCDIHFYGNSEELVTITSDSKISSVWLAVVEFIKWYNDNKK